VTVMPVNPDLLVWAREHRGLSLIDAAKLTGIEGPELDRIERGAPVNLTNFRKISTKYRIPGATLLRRTRPNVPPMPRDFRTFEGRRPVIGFETRLAIDYARTIEQNILELVESGFGPDTPVLPRISLTEEPAEAGERERERMGVTVASQLGWRVSDAFSIWRALIERKGCYVLFQNFDVEQCRGFTLYDNLNTPIIMISKKEELDPARTFTLIHEYAHLLLREPGISDQNRNNPVEAYCNKFSAAFLIPRSALRAVLPQWPNSPVDWALGDIRDLAAKLKVSHQTLALRLEELGLAPDGFFGRIRASQRHKGNRATNGGNYNNTQLFEMGNRFLQAVFSALDSGDIGAAEAADMTHISPRYFDLIRGQVEQKFERASPHVGGLFN
jgi:Zn-dependent peptidase ImmA (M78 family)/transcriptional regulator with XRE-family HTH domain